MANTTHIYKYPRVLTNIPTHIIHIGEEDSMIAEEYDPTKSYTVGALVIYNGILYQCISDTTGEFNESDWQVVMVADVVSQLQSEIDQSNHNTLLRASIIPNTTQTFAYYTPVGNEKAKIHTITHTDSDSNVIRTDVFTYSSTQVTQVRTLSDGSTLTLVTDYSDLDTTVTQVDQ